MCKNNVVPYRETKYKTLNVATTFTDDNVIPGDMINIFNKVSAV